MVPVVLLLGVVAWVSLRDVDVNQYKPVWWLVSDAEKGSPRVRDAALLYGNCSGSALHFRIIKHIPVGATAHRRVPCLLAEPHGNGRAGLSARLPVQLDCV